jgi:phosphate starvation-inducible PhoH-like protein
VEGISFVQFDDKDVVRHSLVQKIVRAYERYNEAIGANRQLSLKLSEPAAEPTLIERTHDRMPGDRIPGEAPAA